MNIHSEFTPSGLATRLAAAAALGGLLLAAPAQASEALAKKYACAACHQVDRKVVGPSFKDIGAKYADGSVKPEALAARIKAGSSGRWGPVPMPAQPQVPAEDLATLSSWILSMKK
ncbi:c-type cytochrome [Roseateles sp. P5_E11]